MLIKNKKHFSIGVVMGLGFAGMLLIIMSPVFAGKNGLEFADDIFNKLAKGSSYFVPEMAKSAEKHQGEHIALTMKYDDIEVAQRTAKLLMMSGAKAEQGQNSLKVEGDLGKILENVIRDSDYMYKNEGEKVANARGFDCKQVLKDWWQALDKMSKAFQTAKLFNNAKIVSDVNKKVVEPAYNFYTIEAVKVSERAGTLGGLLLFYVLYTLWWGFALLYLVEGIGLTTKKARAKKED